MYYLNSIYFPDNRQEREGPSFIQPLFKASSKCQNHLGGSSGKSLRSKLLFDCIKGGDWVSIHLTLSLSCLVHWAIPLHKFTAIGVTHGASADPTPAEEVPKHSRQRRVKGSRKSAHGHCISLAPQIPGKSSSMPRLWHGEGGDNLEYPSLCLHAAPSAHNIHPVLLSALPAFPSITDNLLVSECTYYRTVRGVFVSTTR